MAESSSQQLFTPSQDKVLALSSAISGSLSVIASSIIVFKITTSTDRLNSPYARILFGLCVSDIFVSLGNATSTFLSPSGTAWNAVGNEATCTAQGFFSLLGSVSTPFYNLALCIYYLCVVKYSMRSPQFRRKVEPYLHAIPISWSLFIAIYAAAAGLINKGNGSTCHLAAYPKNCHIDEDVTCERGENIRQIQGMFNGLPTSLIIIAVFGVMIKLGLDVRRQERTMEAYSFRLQFEKRQSAVYARRFANPILVARNNSKQSRLSSLELSSSPNVAGNNSKQSEQSSATTMATLLSTRSSTTLSHTPTRRRRRKSRASEIFLQAFLYFVAYLATFAPIFALCIAEAVYGHGNIPFCFYVLISILYPLQGVFNIFVFIRPTVSKLRRSNRDYSYLRALGMVLVQKDTICITNSDRRQSSRYLASIDQLPTSRASR
jgi:hypothetical protein